MTMKNARHTIAAGMFKAHCLSLLEQVARNREIIVVTKHGRAVAKLVPIDLAEPAPLRGSVRYHGDSVEPSGKSWGCEQ